MKTSFLFQAFALFFIACGDPGDSGGQDDGDGDQESSGGSTATGGDSGVGGSDGGSGSGGETESGGGPSAGGNSGTGGSSTGGSSTGGSNPGGSGPGGSGPGGSQNADGGAQGEIDIDGIGKLCVDDTCPAGLTPTIIELCGSASCTMGCACHLPCEENSTICPEGTECLSLSDVSVDVCF